MTYPMMVKGDNVIAVDNVWGRWCVDTKRKVMPYIQSGEVGVIVGDDNIARHYSGTDLISKKGEWWVQVKFPSAPENIGIEIRNLLYASGDRYKVSFHDKIGILERIFHSESERDALNQAEVYMIKENLNCTNITVKKV